MGELLWNSFLVLKLSFMLRCLAAMVLFSRNQPRQPRYWIRLAAWSVFCFLAAVFFPVFHYSMPYISFLFLVEYLLAMCSVRICCKIAWGEVFYIGAAALCAEHIASMTDSLIAMIRPDILSYPVTQTVNG